jgi:chromosome segregation protein
MYLKSLVLRGFKSFARTTELSIEPGVTCVVGPNGSGKSNIVDALAWVMGEQGAKTMRGAKMDDVIFAGSDGKTAALGRAEVSLTIDNADGVLPIEYTEVTITRTMFRGGGSEYKINGNSCRLLDIQELLSDTGLGKQMHVIVGQGRLDTILNASALDRRSFVEEAAGILKHRQRKDRAMRKLESMQSNLMRLNDLSAEVRRQLGPLGRQADIASRANTIQTTLRDAKARIFADDYVQLLNMKTANQEYLKNLHLELEEHNVQAKKLNKNIDELHKQLENQESREITETIYKLSSLKERFNLLSTHAARTEELLADSALLFEGQDPEVLLKSAEKARKKHAILDAELQEYAKTLEAAKASSKKAQVDAEFLNQKVQIIRKTSTEHREFIAKTTAIIETTQKRIHDEQEHSVTISKQLESIQVDLSSSSKVLEDLDKQLGKVLKSVETATKKVENATKVQEQTAEDVNNLKEQLNKKTHEISATSAKLSALEDMLSQQVGKNSKLVNKNLNTSKYPDLFINLKQTVSALKNELEVPFLVAENQKVANLALEKLPDMNIICPDGKLLYYESPDSNSSGEKVPIQFQIKEVQKELEKTQKEVQKLTELYEKAQKKQLEAKENLATANSELKTYETNARTLQADLVSAQNTKGAKENEIERQTAELNKLAEFIKQREGELVKLSEQLRTSEENKDTSGTTLQEAIDKQALAEANWSVERKNEQEILAKFVRMEAENASQLARANELQKQADAEIQARKLAQIENEKRKKRAVVMQMVQRICHLVLEKIEQTFQEAQKRKDILVQAQVAQNEELSKYNAELKKLQAVIEQAQLNAHKKELDFANTDAKINALEEKMNEQLSLKPDILIAEFGPNVEIKLPDPKDAEKFLILPYIRTEQKKRLRNAERELLALGKVNPLALEEFEALEERHKYLVSQIHDLEKSRTDLMQMINEIDGYTKEEFNSAFEDTAREFTGVFETLFPGGKGRIFLTDPSDLLNTGIEIEATPAGKRISKLSLLSGGERSLVAIALLVSIFKARTSPFYVMDEVEAALDDINLSRLLKIFSSMKKTSQLIIITHQKRTMEIADALYGITMRKDGITQVISQRIEQKDDADTISKGTK